MNLVSYVFFSPLWFVAVDQLLSRDCRDEQESATAPEVLNIMRQDMSALYRAAGSDNENTMRYQLARRAKMKKPKKGRIISDRGASMRVRGNGVEGTDIEAV